MNLKQKLYSLVMVIKRRIDKIKLSDIIVAVLLIIGAALMLIPLIMIVDQAFSPIGELGKYSSGTFAGNYSIVNFVDLKFLIAEDWVPFSRYIFNSVVILVLGVFGHVFLVSLAAFPLAKHKFPGKKLLTIVVIVSLMYSLPITQIPRYLVIDWLGMENTYWAFIMPAWSWGLGLYLMKQYMEQIPDMFLDEARIDGAGEFYIYRHIVMPNVRPACMALGFIQFLLLWSNTGLAFISDKQRLPIQHVFERLLGGGEAYLGMAAAATLISIAVPLLIFIICRRNVIETLTTSGMKD